MQEYFSRAFCGESLVFVEVPLVFFLNNSCAFVIPEVKRRKRHRRKHFENQEPCLMRGVYFKNMKWQAAIKVDKKQIHLGTVGTQEEAARLYDRYHTARKFISLDLC